jgi:S1-C subfamily serine protease
VKWVLFGPVDLSGRLTSLRESWRRSLAAALALALAAAAVALAAGRAEGSSGSTRSVELAVVNIVTSLSYQGGAAAGTGIVVSPSGLVLTNNHVIRGAASIRATDVGNGRTYRATVLGYSLGNDVAVLQLQNASGLATAPIGDSSALKVGQAVTALGNAGGGGGRPLAATGKVTGLGRSITAGDEQGSSERLTGLIEIDASLQPGDSGGPLVDSAGRVIGMDTAASVGFQFAQTSSRGYAVPIARALTIAKLVQAGKESATLHIGPTAMLGVRVGSPDAYSSFASGGALVVDVVSGSPADRAGVASGDVIIALGGKKVSSPDALSSAMLRRAPNDSVGLVWVDELGSRAHATVRLASGPPQ